jgi:hypothetical protein
MLGASIHDLHLVRAMVGLTVTSHTHQALRAMGIGPRQIRRLPSDAFGKLGFDALPTHQDSDDGYWRGTNTGLFLPICLLN